MLGNEPPSLEIEGPTSVRTVPTLSTSFVGRTRELASVTTLLRQNRVVTLLGPGGIGKTRLALEVAATSDALWEQPVGFCDLSACRDVEAMCEAIAYALGIGAMDGLRDLIPRALEVRGRSLLILDNVEQLLPSAAPVIAEWSMGAPLVCLLVTSREMLRVGAEAVFEVKPLAEAGELYIDRASRVRHDYTPDEAERKVIEDIVRRLDGIPLAVELAAARASVLSASDLRERLDGRFEILSSGRRDQARRQATIHDTIAWSWDLLDDDEQRALAACSVFRGGFSVSLAEAVLSAGRTEASPEPIDLLQALRDKSLLRDLQVSAHGLRFGMYESIRYFAADKLQGKTAVAVRCHFGEVLVGFAEGKLEGSPGSEEVLSAVSAERENLHVCLEGLPDVPQGVRRSLALRAGSVLDALLPDEGISNTELRHLDAALASSGDAEPLHLAAALLARASKRAFMADSRAHGDAERALAIAVEQRDPGLQAAAHYSLGAASYSSSALEDALASFSRAKSMFRDLRNHWGEARCLQQEAACLQSLNRPSAALERLRDCLALSKQHGCVRGEVRAHAGLGFHHLEAGELESTRHHYERCLRLAREVGARRTAMLVTGYLGLAYFDHDRLDDALEYLDAATIEARESGYTRAEGVFTAIAAAVRAARDEPQEAREGFDAAKLMLRDSGIWSRVAAIHRGHLSLGLARQAAAAGKLEHWKRQRAVARRVADEVREADASGSRLIDSSDDARIALRILECALGRATRPESTAHVAADAAAAQRLLVARDIEWFQLGEAPRVDLKRRAVLRKIVDALCKQHESKVGKPIAVASLLEAGWPGEKMARSAALNRLYVALATLRSLGLRPILQRRKSGYLFDVRVALEWSDDRG